MKKYKQTHNLSRIFLLTFFVFTSLFSTTGIIYSLITVGIGSSLFLLCSTGFITCTMFSAYNAYAIHKNITHSRALKKVAAYDIDKKPKSLEAKLENLIDPNEKHNTQQSTSNTPEVSKEALIPEVAKNVDELNSTFNDPKPLNPLNNRVTTTSNKQRLKSPSQTQGTSFNAPSTSKTAIQHPVFNRPQTPLFPSTPKAADKSKVLLQLQDTNNPIPIPPPMPPITYDNSKVLPQSQDTINKSTPTPNTKETDQQSSSTASKLQTPPPPPMPDGNSYAGGFRVKTQSQQDISNKHNSIASTATNDGTNGQISEREIEEAIKNLRKVNKEAADNDGGSHAADKPKISPLKTSSDTTVNVADALRAAFASEGREEAFRGSGSEDSDSSSSDSEWEEDVETSPKAQNNKPAEDYVESNNHDDNIDSGMSGCSSPETVNNTTEKTQKPDTLLRSSSFLDLKGEIAPTSLPKLKRSYSESSLPPC